MLRSISDRSDLQVETESGGNSLHIPLFWVWSPQLCNKRIPTSIYLHTLLVYMCMITERKNARSLSVLIEPIAIPASSCCLSVWMMIFPESDLALTRIFLLLLRPWFSPLTCQGRFIVCYFRRYANAELYLKTTAHHVMHGTEHNSQCQQQKKTTCSIKISLRPNSFHIYEHPQRSVCAPYHNEDNTAVVFLSPAFCSRY